MGGVRIRNGRNANHAFRPPSQTKMNPRALRWPGISTFYLSALTKLNLIEQRRETKACNPTLALGVAALKSAILGQLKD